MILYKYNQLVLLFIIIITYHIILLNHVLLFVLAGEGKQFFGSQSQRKISQYYHNDDDDDDDGGGSKWNYNHEIRSSKHNSKRRRRRKRRENVNNGDYQSTGYESYDDDDDDDVDHYDYYYDQKKHYDTSMPFLFISDNEDEENIIEALSIPTPTTTTTTPQEDDLSNNIYSHDYYSYDDNFDHHHDDVSKDYNDDDVIEDYYDKNDSEENINYDHNTPSRIDSIPIPLGTKQRKIRKKKTSRKIIIENHVEDKDKSNSEHNQSSIDTTTYANQNKTILANHEQQETEYNQDKVTSTLFKHSNRRTKINTETINNNNELYGTSLTIHPKSKLFQESSNKKHTQHGTNTSPQEQTQATTSYQPTLPLRPQIPIEIPSSIDAIRERAASNARIRILKSSPQFNRFASFNHHQHQQQQQQQQMHQHPIQQNNTPAPEKSNIPSLTSLQRKLIVQQSTTRKLPTTMSLTTPWARKFILSKPKDALLPIPRDFLTDGFNLVHLAPIIEQIVVNNGDDSTTHDENANRGVRRGSSSSSSLSLYKAALRLILDDSDSSNSNNVNSTKFPTHTNKTLTNTLISSSQHNAATIQKAAEVLYTLVHSRYVTSPRGLDTIRRMFLRNYELGTNEVFGKCPRMQCNGNPLLPLGMSCNYDLHGKEGIHRKSLRYCCSCGEVSSKKE